MDESFWKEQIICEYGVIALPEHNNYQQHYERLKEFWADPDTFRYYFQEDIAF